MLEAGDAADSAEIISQNMSPNLLPVCSHLSVNVFYRIVYYAWKDKDRSILEKYKSIEYVEM